MGGVVFVKLLSDKVFILQVVNMFSKQQLLPGSIPDAIFGGFVWLDSSNSCRRFLIALELLEDLVLSQRYVADPCVY